eukprot:CAMPEP_0113874302 /NCGR_PEP_ID=MMETSP0780_2-20120614/4254_1 /TAXON_ID=652834 /ORGANISM="Palpitomonas bilix" /LENGTH=170 /DNA_ID=CAMNT_0000860051 /DNA_START=148 /DNA_END=660 /DNA_ORIENTATION=+ /assembly_acc=CAM_ASM_000599
MRAAKTTNIVKEKQSQRLAYIVAGTVAVGTGFFLILNAFEDNLLFFMTPSQVMEQLQTIPENKKFRLGGLVKEGSVAQQRGSTQISFVVTDLQDEMKVTYGGVLPDLFREGQSVVVEGYAKRDSKGALYFSGTEVLAKHDENYMPAAVAEKVNAKKQAGEEVENHQHVTA